MNRRQFISAATLATVEFPALGQYGALEQYQAGRFLIARSGTRLSVSHEASPNRVLWESGAKGTIAAQVANADIRAFGTPQGAFEIKDKILQEYASPVIERIAETSGKVQVTGRLSNGSNTVAFLLTFEARSDRDLRFQISCEGPGTEKINRIVLNCASAKDEAVFGFGEQLTFFNQKGNVLPILVQEHGVGRGRPIVTQVVNAMANKGGGDPYVTEAPSPHYLTSRLRSLFLENLEYSVFDLRVADTIQIKVYASEMSGSILYGDTPLELIEAYTSYAGRMHELPDWMHEGAIISLQGGTDVVTAKLDKIFERDVPLAALWIQDWTGQRITSVGKQLWWNWRLDESFYPRWNELVAKLNARGARMLIYVNPFLSNEEGHNSMFTEAAQRNFLVRKPDGSPYLIKNTNFYAGLIDLSNPDARAWMTNIIQTEMIDKAGANGWMADFGEALPFDAKLFGDSAPMLWHNRYPVEWAKVNRNAIQSANRASDITFFSRSGFTQSPGVSTLFWLGDQLQSWDEYDGIKTAVVGLLSGGVSGFSLLHSDIGGYGALSIKVGKMKTPIVARSPELLMRWMELNAFTSVFRTHEGLDPAVSAQIDTNEQTWNHLQRFARIYKGLATYRKNLVREAAEHGYPVVRHLFLHYPDDANTYTLRYQFLMGPDLMVAPVVDKGATKVNVYFPKGTDWLDLWTGQAAGQAGKSMAMPAPLGRPAVFLRNGSTSNAEILPGLKAVGIL